MQRNIPGTISDTIRQISRGNVGDLNNAVINAQQISGQMGAYIPTKKINFLQMKRNRYNFEVDYENSNWYDRQLDLKNARQNGFHLYDQNAVTRYARQPTNFIVKSNITTQRARLNRRIITDNRLKKSFTNRYDDSNRNGYTTTIYTNAENLTNDINSINPTLLLNPPDTNISSNGSSTNPVTCSCINFSD